ncbi:hypothetical protein NPS01_05570 [Nocardioides psychrotolerans]|uniref:DUF3515 domain-containing protein n=1 Tax=Nocardioides psychrotolerans TaxID=1005945 RepID=A0A1I3CTS8_9ACTN|nr:DUF3515 domain-containing protein [Nocardioides psychrotolerans]GEP36894.1 hypothetical protein NPS01_05570 [Nocardioides psychrotolerans]SFH77679.1 Protein of unknown function [Nocardioides psychrotolerans]
MSLTHFRRRPGPARVRGVAASAAFPTLATLSLLLSACSSTPEIASADLGTEDQQACEQLVDALPATLNDLEQVDVEPADALGAAWGDPAIVLTCGVALPDDYDPFSTCDDVNGVGWFAPPDSLEEDAQDEQVTVTAVSYRPLIQLVVPADYRPDGVSAALTDLTEAVKSTLRLEQPCT